MKKFWPIPVFGGAVAAFLYATLLLIAPASTVEDDPWSGPLGEAGLRVQFRSVTDERRGFAIIERRDAIQTSEFSGTVLRDYVVEGYKVQIATFPADAPLNKIALDGAKRNWRPGKESARTYHVFRLRRHVLVLATSRPFFVKRDRTPDALVDQLFAAFERAVEDHEDTKD